MTAERIQKNKVPSWLGNMRRGAGCKGQGAITKPAQAQTKALDLEKSLGYR